MTGIGFCLLTFGFERHTSIALSLLFAPCFLPFQKMPTAFITRHLAPDSDFRSILAAQGWQVAGQSLVLLTPLPFGSVPPCDWIFFSSQNAVRYFFEQAALLPDWTEERASAVRWAAIGPATARAMLPYVKLVHFVGSGEGSGVGLTRGGSQSFSSPPPSTPKKPYSPPCSLIFSAFSWPCTTTNPYQTHPAEAMMYLFLAAR